MTIKELYNKLQNLGVSNDKYYLHGLYGSTDDNDKICLTIRKGKFIPEYEVYYKERGEKHSIKIFTDESEACQYLLKKIHEELTFNKVDNIDGFNGMTVNERLYATGLVEEFDNAIKDNKPRAEQILRILRVDESSIKRIVQQKNGA